MLDDTLARDVACRIDRMKLHLTKIDVPSIREKSSFDYVVECLVKGCGALDLCSVVSSAGFKVQLIPLCWQRVFRLS